MENKIYLTVDTLKRKYTSLLPNELSYMFLHQMDIKKAPGMAARGNGYVFSQPNLLKHLTSRSGTNRDDIFNQSFPQDKAIYTTNPFAKEDKQNLMHAFLLVKYLVTQYAE